jgi:hypothetical protein
MVKNDFYRVDAGSWQEWKNACSIGSCESKVTVAQLSAFGRSRLRNALHRYSPETASLYCGSDGRNTDTAWLKIEQYLYAGVSERQTREGKAYKDRLWQECSNQSHFEGILTRVIQRDITRWILAEEGFDIAQKTDSETGHKRYVVTRRQSLDEEINDLQAQLEGVYAEPAAEEDDDAVEQATACQARHVWDTFENPKRSVQRILLACFLNGAHDMKALAASDLVPCKQSQLYNERTKVLTFFEALDWGPDCLTASARAYMTRRMMPELKICCDSWLNSLENQKLKLFIEKAGDGTR